MIRFLKVFLIATFVFGTAWAWGQSCAQNNASDADRDLWAHHGCWKDFFLWQYKAYDIRKSDWSDRGWNDACNVNTEYAKHWNAAYLVSYGLADNPRFSFHGTVDYRATAERWDNQYHDDIYHTPSDSTDYYGAFIFHLLGANEVRTSCLLYDKNKAPNANPASRAGDFMHEGWHAWSLKHLYYTGSCGGHICGPKGACYSSDCDYFYFHGIGAYAFGAMWENDGTAKRFHSMNQVQVEFLCDIATYPQPWVPASVTLAAKSEVNTRSVQRFINGPGYICGDDRPW